MIVPELLAFLLAEALPILLPREALYNVTLSISAHRI